MRATTFEGVPPDVTPHPKSVWMILFLLVGVMCMGMCGCAPRRAPAINTMEPSTRFTLRAYPPLMLRPMGSVKFTGILGEAAAVECPGVVWEWGDGTSPSTHEAMCHGEVPTSFHRVHFFKAPGRYDVVLSLWKGGRRVRHTMVTVQIGAPEGGM